MKPIKLVAAVSFALAFSGSALAETITFEDLDATARPTFVPDGYPGTDFSFAWNNVWVESLSNVAPVDFPGYVNSGLSGNFAIASHTVPGFDAGLVSGFSTTTPFNFVSATLAPAYVPLTLTVEGFQTGAGAPAFTSGPLSLNPGGGFYDFNFTNINEVRFTVSGVDPVDAEIGMDNLTVTAVPEPSTYALLLAGLGMIGFAARRRSAR